MRKKAWKKSGGQIEIVTGMYILVLLVMLTVMQLQMRIYATASYHMEDALAASNLASAVIDVREYGTSLTIQIESPDTAYGLYREAIRQNLGLDDNWESSNQNLISGSVEILEYTIYNVSENDVTVYDFGEDGSCHSWNVENGLGSVRAPDGTLIESTSVYSRIGFIVDGVFGVSVYACKDKTVDIVSNLSEEE